MTETIQIETWRTYVASLPFRSRFVTVSGAHLYGFPSHDSDVDLRGCHQLPLEQIVGLSMENETVDRSSLVDGIEVDIVSHDLGKYFTMLLKNNGYVLEQIFSPIVIQGEDFLKKLKPIANRCITRHHYHHYQGFYSSQRKLIENEETKRVKSVLYAYRVLLTGQFLMETGIVESNLVELSEHFGLEFISDLIASKTSEKVVSDGLDWTFHSSQLDSQESKLKEAFSNSKLPADRDRDAVNQFLVETRMTDRK